MSVVDLSAGRAVRRRRVVETTEDQPGALVVEHFVPPPGGSGDPTVLVLTDSTPRLPWEEATLVLLDGIATTLRWT